MIKNLKFLVTVLLISTFAFATDEAPKKQMFADLDFIRNTFEFRYGPAEWKRDFCGWDIGAEVAKSKERISAINDITIKDYQKEIVRLLNSTKDYHVGTYFYSTELASLPFTVKSAEGAYFITTIDRDSLSEDQYPFEVGDELVFFDKKPVKEVIEKLKESCFMSNSPLTEQSKAEQLLTFRAGTLGMDVPQGPINISVKSFCHP